MLLLTLGTDTLDLSDWQTNGIYVGTVDIGAPATREVANDHPDRDGVFDETAYVGARVISLSGQIIASAAAGTRQQIRDRLAKFCQPSTRPTLTIAMNDDVPRTIVLRPDQYAAPIDKPGRCPFAASFKAPDPWFYSTTRQSVSVLPKQSLSDGRTYDLVYPRTYPASWGAAGYTPAVVGGAAATWPKHTIYGPCTNPAIRNRRTIGGVDTVVAAIVFGSLTLSGADILVVDTATRSVILNGTTDRYSTLDVTKTSWAPMRPGTENVWFEPSAFAQPCILVTSWNDAYQ